VFESFAEQRAVTRTRSRLILVGSASLHAALLAVWVFHSFWQVETLSAPMPTITLLPGFGATASIPPAAVPELRPRARTRRVARPSTPVAVDAERTVQPAAEPASDSDHEADDGEVDSRREAPGPAGTTAGDGRPAVTMLAMDVVRAQLAINPREDPYRPHLPKQLNRPGSRFFGVLIACVNANGIVESAKVVQSAHPLLDPELLSKVKTWKFIPYQVGGRPTPFCFMWRCSMRSAWMAGAGG
jgi:hypothetical protein